MVNIQIFLKMFVIVNKTRFNSWLNYTKRIILFNELNKKNSKKLANSLNRNPKKFRITSVHSRFSYIGHR